MATSTMVIIIVIASLALYAVPSIPISVTTLLAVLAMAQCGAVTYTEALSGFSSSAVFLVVGMMIVGKACYSTGLANLLGRWMYRFTGSGERRFIVIMFVFVSIMCAMINTTAFVALMMPVLDSIERMSDNKISRKMTYFPLGVASVLGTGLSTISSSSMIAANEMLSAAGYRQLAIFEPALVNLPALIVIIIFYGTIGYDIQKKWFNFEEIPPFHADEEVNELAEHPVTWKMVLSALTLVGVVVGILLGAPTSAVSLVASSVLILSGCVSEIEAFKGVSWSTVTIVGASIGYSTAIDKSGAGAIMAEAIINLAGSFAQSTLGMCIIVFFICSVLSNLLADTGTVAIMMPIIFALSAQLGLDVIPLALACTAGTKVALATPICTANMTMIKVPGYRFLDYVRMGGLVNIICMVVTCVTIAIVYVVL